MHKDSNLVRKKLLIVGNFGKVHIGSHLYYAAKGLGVDTNICDYLEAYNGSILSKKINWWLRGHRPSNLRGFGSKVLQICVDLNPDFLITSGIAPLDLNTLLKIGKLSVKRLIYLTDDPWNSAHYAPWFFECLPFYDQIFSPRKANIKDLYELGCRCVSYLPFAYSPEIHFSEKLDSHEDLLRYDTDVVFTGGADKDRIPYISVLIKEGIRVSLWGGYWDRYIETIPYFRGYADVNIMRKVISGAKISLCLVRRANRDGHVMRSYEVPAMSGCMIAEDTIEHRDIFGEEGKAVKYFKNIKELVDKTRWLLNNNEERQRMAIELNRLITRGNNTYSDRLFTMLTMT